MADNFLRSPEPNGVSRVFFPGRQSIEIQALLGALFRRMIGHEANCEFLKPWLGK
jgi:hypothetical protein